NVSVGDVLNAVKIIESFEPRPGRNYTNEGVNYIIPDVYIFEADGSYRIMLNDEGVPRLRLSNYYRKLLANKNSLAPEDKQFLEKKLRSAVWLLKSLDQRNKTIYKVTENILKFQEDFFRKGIEFLRPLNLKDVAGELGMHESTVSRVTSNKYLQCPRGLFSFRFFFSSAIKGQTADVSSASVKDIIKRIITEENHDAPLSDQQIVEMLKNKNITIARRTVAKYRDELKISSHGRRKRWS
ncbi:MAG TPA: RNA polymerase sigma-54 factor, partial [Nitrospiraceae bacterium]|nr:RNA polymerase sigma-54 factor [Nitrospiraceae bacterium]